VSDLCTAWSRPAELGFEVQFSSHYPAAFLGALLSFHAESLPILAELFPHRLTSDILANGGRHGAAAHGGTGGTHGGGRRRVTRPSAQQNQTPSWCPTGTALQLMAERAEYMAAGGPEARAVAGPATAATARNIALAGALAEVARSLRALLPRLPPTAASALECVLAALNSSQWIGASALISHMLELP